MPSEVGSLKIGVLAAQGAFAEHIAALRNLDVESFPVRLFRDLRDADALIIPGGESTTISRLMIAYDLTKAVQERVDSGMAVFGTCAGMIMLARTITDGNGVQPLNLMDISVRRNAFGRQKDSFETDIRIEGLGNEPFHAVFIRAPLVETAGPEVKVLARLENGSIVAARQGRVLVSAFHPELTNDLRFHRYFVEMVQAT